jgi:hypothetical protein
MPSLRNQNARNSLLERLQRLTPASTRQWGQMDASRMICHLGDALSMALGDLPVKPIKAGPFQYFPLKHLILYVFPMPKGVPTAPELLSSLPDSFESDRSVVAERIQRMAAAPRGAGPVHPFFGPLTNEEWNALQYQHIDHHLKQFGL